MKKKKKLSVMGRPPAKWVYELAAVKLPDNEYLDYHQLSEMFGVSLRTVHGFCTKLEVEGEYYKTDEKAVRKRFKVKVLKKVAARYLSVRGVTC